MTESGPSTERTKAHRLLRWDILSIGVGALIVTGYLLLYNFVLTRDEQGIVAKGVHFDTEVVVAKEDQARGLSGRDKIDQHAAMVFEFSEVKQHCMWMKDMKFPIDIIWLDESRKVVAMERNVSPDTYPRSFCHDGKAVVEFAAGTADRIPLDIGDTIQ